MCLSLNLSTNIITPIWFPPQVTAAREKTKRGWEETPAPFYSSMPLCSHLLGFARNTGR